jgi:uncharacterized membrane protein HdeD (DUF308 family)
MTTNVSTDIKPESKGSLLIGILLSVLGIVAIALPTISTIFAESCQAALRV